MLHCPKCGAREIDMLEVDNTIKCTDFVPYGDTFVPLETIEGEIELHCECGEILSKDDLIETEYYSSDEVSEFFENDFDDYINLELASAFELIKAGKFELAGKIVSKIKVRE